MKARKQQQPEKRIMSPLTMRRRTARVYGMIRQRKNQIQLSPMSVRF